MRDPRALLAAQIGARAYEKDPAVFRFTTWWRTGGRRQSWQGKIFVTKKSQVSSWLRRPRARSQDVDAKRCAIISRSISIPKIVLNPTKVGRSWAGNSAAGDRFSEISIAPVTRWRNELQEDEVGWVEWHCRDLMPEFGYEPRLNRRSLRYFMKPIRGERPKEFLKSRAYSLRDRFTD